MGRNIDDEDVKAARAAWAHRGAQRPPWADVPEPGQESVWDYPRPAVCEPTASHLSVEVGGRIIADTRRGFRALETSHPPTYYIPPEDVRLEYFRSRPGTTFCEWKGEARYWDIVVPGTHVRAGAAWAYAEPFPDFEAVAGYFAFYAKDMDACRVDGEVARPQPGGFYAGWVTSRLAGPFKGDAGSGGW